jgi:hypothetical protein
LKLPPKVPLVACNHFAKGNFDIEKSVIEEEQAQDDGVT